MHRATPRESAIDAALSRLVSPPTNAPIASRPTAGLSGPEPSVANASTTCPSSEGAPPGWLRADALRESEWWQRLARMYSDGLETPHLPVGGACALQHYSGRFALMTLGVWAQTGYVLPMEHAQWWLRLNDRGHTTAVSVPDLSGGAAECSVADVAHAMLVEHLRPVVDAVRAATRITDRVAFGCIAASCAGAFGALYRRCDPGDRTRVYALAEQFLSQPGWPTTAPLVRLAQLELDQGTTLVHERRVCCLIRLGKNHGTCETCPDIGATERAERVRARAAAAIQGDDMPVTVRR